MKNLTKLIQENAEKGFKAKEKNMIAMIGSIFSVIFSLSIVFELKRVVDGYVLAFLIVFVVIFLILNEKYKVDNIRRVYKGNKKNILSFGVTFLISVTLSSIGIYLWTNKSFDSKLENDKQTVTQEFLIKDSYQSQINEVKNREFSETTLYTELKESIDYWKTRKAADIDERNDIRKEVKVAENKLEQERAAFNRDKNDDIVRLESMRDAELTKVNTLSTNNLKTIDFNTKISYIFLIMILITELGIIILNKEMAEVEEKVSQFVNSDMAKKYLLARKVLTSLYLTKDKDNKTSITHALYSAPVQKMNASDDKKWNAVKSFYNLLINLGILDDGEVKKSNKEKKSILVNTILLDEKTAMDTLDNYYNKLLSL